MVGGGWAACQPRGSSPLTAAPLLPARCRFYFPYRHSLSESKLYYSYDVAGAHVIMLSSYSRESRAVAGVVVGMGLGWPHCGSGTIMLSSYCREWVVRYSVGFGLVRLVFTFQSFGEAVVRCGWEGMSWTGGGRSARWTDPCLPPCRPPPAT